MKTNTISKHLGSFVVIGVMLITAPATVAFAGRIFGWLDVWGAMRSVLLIFVTEIAALAWHRISKNLARGEAQHSIASSMTWVSLIGVVMMAGIEIGIEFAGRNANDVSGLVGVLSVVGLVILVVLMGANLMAGVAFQNADPDYVEKRNEERLNESAQSVQNELTERTIETVRNQISQRKNELMAPRVDAILQGMMDRQNLLAAQDRKRLLDVSDETNVIQGVAAPVEKPKTRTETIAATPEDTNDFLSATPLGQKPIPTMFSTNGKQH